MYREVHVQHIHMYMHVRGARTMFCHLDEQMALLLCFLHYIIDQFHNTCDKKKLYPILCNHFHSMRQNVR